MPQGSSWLQTQNACWVMNGFVSIGSLINRLISLLRLQTFNTLNQSPCDVAASLAAVCSPTGREHSLAYIWPVILLEHAGFNLDPLPSGYVYAGPRTESATSCRCSSVFYSMLSACGYCQSRNYQKWEFWCMWDFSSTTYRLSTLAGLNTGPIVLLSLCKGINIFIFQPLWQEVK